jgi:uncharacterized membrane protein HdeD (DUF308 family)
MKNIVSELVTTIKHWWLFLVVGILMFIGGVWVVRTPVASYVTLSWLFGVLVLADGFFYVFFSLSNTRHLAGWGWYLAIGILEVLIGLYLFMNPVILLTILPFVVGFWLMFRGISMISSSLDLKNHSIRGWGWVLTFGILLTIVSFWMIVDPTFGAMNVIMLTSFALIFLGISYILLSFKLKKIKSKTLDVLDDYKQDAVAFVREMKQTLEDNMEDIPENVAGALKAKFEEYEKKVQEQGK